MEKVLKFNINIYTNSIGGALRCSFEVNVNSCMRAEISKELLSVCA